MQAADVGMFLEQAQLATQNMIQATCMNKARMRRRLKSRLEDYSNLYTHAHNADYAAEMESYLEEAGWEWPKNAGPNFPPGPCSVRRASVCSPWCSRYKSSRPSAHVRACAEGRGEGMPVMICNVGC